MADDGPVSRFLFVWAIAEMQNNRLERELQPCESRNLFKAYTLQVYKIMALKLKA